ncbi:aldehyde dehydrogenase (NAD) family protein [Sulfobacillus acidophilus TPY]|uniref:Aldehyde Dehydrogenase n=1 Tax=Sulfobacillus acidophilus (strain ATCC 700253 / DSM 10332 / NAL) TaxID=679936 RepID=G8TY23_SULAD|nr:aldehyde dehydrogenase (NAD) family protein [Sulfobacillus acidophilus TPY]AEW03930.1 Aldehyde Dehydrogenase [Sulfobacillus acidophilus DSM 10332]
MASVRGSYINGQEVTADQTYPVTHKYTGAVLADVTEATPALMDEAVRGAEDAFRHPLSVPQRVTILERAAEILGRDQERIARLIAQEAGKPIKDARVEVQRGQQTLRYSAVAARTLRGLEIPVRGNPGSENRLAFTVRKPYGVVLAITPFNFPLNLVLHKVGPALAAGNTVVLKPAPATPLTALALAGVLAEAGLPPGYLQVVTGASPEVGARLVADPRVRLITFTGSAAVGQTIRAQAGLRPVLLELGNNSANIVHEDADLDRAAKTLAIRAFGFAGQVCISVQRIYVHRAVYQPFLDRLTEAVSQLVVGDPEDEATDVGPMITEAAAERAFDWYQESLRQGARAVIPGMREGSLVHPGLLVDVAPSMRVMAEEVFAPIAGVVPYDEFKQALAWANESRYGLQAGVFTHNLELAWQAVQTLEVGGVILNDSSSYRADNMPYGGVKDSGIGREGPEFAIEEMTYPTVAVFNLPAGPAR